MPKGHSLGSKRALEIGPQNARLDAHRLRQSVDAQHTVHAPQVHRHHHASIGAV